MKYLNSSDINLIFYGIYIIKFFLETNNLEENAIDILNDQLNDEYLLLLTNLLNKNNNKLSYEILYILTIISYTDKGELLFGQEEKVIFNISSFLGNNRKDINLLNKGILLIKNITNKNSFVKKALQKYNIISFFNEIYEKYIFEKNFMNNLIICLGHFIKSRFGDNNILCSIKIIKSQLYLNLPAETLFRYVYILYELSYYNKPEVFETMIKYQIQKDFMNIYPFEENNKENKINEQDKIENKEEKENNYPRKLRLIIIKLLGKIMSSNNDSITRKVMESGISKFLNKLFQSTDIKIIKNTFYCLSNICAGTCGQLLDLYINFTINEAFKVAEYIYETLDTNNKFLISLINDDYIKTFREINYIISLVIINSLYDQIMPYARNHNFVIVKILIKGIKIFSENYIDKNKTVISLILNAISKLNSFIMNEGEEEIIKYNNNIIFSEFLEQNGFKEILEKLETNSDENIADLAEGLYDEIYGNDDENNNNEDININDIIDESGDDE